MIIHAYWERMPIPMATNFKEHALGSWVRIPFRALLFSTVLLYTVLMVDKSHDPLFPLPTEWMICIIKGFEMG
jgi:hypothetical protein